MVRERLHVPLALILRGGSMPDVDLSAARQKQLDLSAKTAWFHLPCVAIAALAIIADNLTSAPAGLLAGYGIAVAAILIVRRWRTKQRRIGWVEGSGPFFRNEIILGSLLAIALTAPMAWFVWTGDARSASNAWIALAAMMAVYGMGTASVPILFCSVMPLVGLLSAIGLALTGNYASAFSAVLLSAAGAMAIINAGRDFIRFALVGRKADERAETVSLLLREFEDTSADWLWQVDPNRRIQRASPRFAHAAGMDAESMEGVTFVQLLAGEGWERGNLDPALHEIANRLNRRESFSGVIVPFARDDGVRYWELSASPYFDATGNFSGFRGVGSDVTQQRASADRIAHLARFDGLTGLPNRLHINETLSGALEQATAWRRRCAFLMIDLDRFKAVNDTLGHPIGDRLLAQVAGRLNQLGNENVSSGRLGGDEFAVVMREIAGTEDVERLGARLVDHLSRPYEVDQHTIYVGASIGYAIGPRDGATVEALTRNADLALYRSKEQGGGTVSSYEPSLHDQARERREIEIELRSALSRNEFTVLYQPVVHSDGSIDGFEALLRWNNRKLGNVSPVRFVSVAEDSRLIGPIGEWVLQTACREAMNWPDTTKVAVNVSAEQLSSPGFVGAVVKALSHSGIRPARLELEVTESVFLREVAGAMTVLDQVRALGVKLVLDDFGTGYSSLGYLRMGQFSTIKVDRSFVQGALAGARESIAIIRAVVALADSLEMSTTAEGVENQAEADSIVALGCKKLQGYHFGRPMPADDVRAIFTELGYTAVGRVA